MDVHGQHPSGFSNFGGQPESEIAGAGAQVRHHLAVLQAQGVQHNLRTLLLFALRAIEPRHAACPHDLGDLPAHIEPSRPVGVVDRVNFIKRWGLRAWGLQPGDKHCRSIMLGEG